MDSNKIIESAKDKIKSKVGKVILNPINELVDQNLTDVTTTIGSFIIRSIRGKFQRSITFNIGRNYADKWMEEALYGILYEYNNIKSSSRLEIANKAGLYDGTGMYYRLDDGTHNLKYRNWNILLCIQTITQQVTTARSSIQRLYTIITYDLSPEFVKLFEKDMITHRNSLLKIKSDSPTVNVFQDYHESDGWTYWEKSSTINKRKLATIYLPLETKQKIVDTVNEFFGNKEYYKRHGIAHNLKILLYGPPGPQPLDTPIPTPSGFTNMGDLNPGDMVLNLAGRPTEIEDIREYDDLDEYTIVFEDGRYTRCAETHRWPLISHTDGKLVDFTVEELIGMAEDKGDGVYTISFNKQIEVPLMFGAQYEYKRVSLDPWVMGVIIAGGRFVMENGLSISPYHFLTISTEDNRVIDELCRRMNWKCIDHDMLKFKIFMDRKNSPITLNYLYANYPDIMGCVDEEIPLTFISFPEKYVMNSYGVRWMMIQGVMDAIGEVHNSTVAGYDKGNFREERLKDASVNFKNNSLSYQFISILRSVGLRVRRITDDDSGDLRITMDKERDQYKLFYCSKHRYEMEKYTINKFVNDKVIDKPTGLRITKIIKTGNKCKMRCLHVSDENHIYLTGDFIPTCNTGKDSIAKMIASEWNRNIYYVTGGKEGRFIPNAITDNDDDINHPLLLISDIDKYPYLINEPDINMGESAKEEMMKYKQIFGNMINALDGVLSAEGRIIIMTTNHIEKFNSTFLRPGRIDLSLEIGYVTPEVFRKYTYDFFGYELPENIELKSDKLTIAALQFDVVFLKLRVEEFIAKHVKSVGEKKSKKENKDEKGV